MKKSNVGVILIVSVLVSFLCGALGSYVILGTINSETGEAPVIKYNSITLWKYDES